MRHDEEGGPLLAVELRAAARTPGRRSRCRGSRSVRRPGRAPAPSTARAPPRRAAAGRPRDRSPGTAGGRRGRLARAGRSRAAASGRRRRPRSASTGIITFSSGRERRQQVVELEDEAERAAAEAPRARAARARRCRGRASAMRPLVGRSSRPSRCSSVLLPDPDGPTSAVNSPGASANETPCSTRVTTRSP